MDLKNNSLLKNNISIMFKLNSRLRILRKDKGWSQSDLGKELSILMNLESPIPTSTVASWEHKDSSLAKIPSEDKINALSTLFNVSTDYLLGLSDDPGKNIRDLISFKSESNTVQILPQELSQHIGEPIWVKSDLYNGWMLLTKYYELVDNNGISHSVKEIRHTNATFSSFPPYNVYQKNIYNNHVISENTIRSITSKIWVCINSPDSKMQQYNGWYSQSDDGIGVIGKTFLSYDSYFDFWIAYDSPIKE